MSIDLNGMRKKAKEKPEQRALHREQNVTQTPRRLTLARREIRTQ